MNLRDLRDKGTGKGFLNDHFLVAMPGMGDQRFARAVIYICAHSDDGAMGFIINQSQPVIFREILLQLGVAREDEIIRLPEAARGLQVRNGGPVDRSRGFVIHYQAFGEALPAGAEAQAECAAVVNRAMERLIRQCPRQYLWGYHRYKAPRGAAPADVSA